MLVLFFRLPSALLARADGNRSDPHLTHAATAFATSAEDLPLRFPGWRDKCHAPGGIPVAPV